MLNEGMKTHGLCECGCGQTTNVFTKNDVNSGNIQGEHAGVIKGHRSKIFPPKEPRLCACGCGARTMVRGGRVSRFAHGHNRMRGPITEDEYSVEYTGYETPCWLWKRYRGRLGYGKVSHRGKVRLAHVVMLEQSGGSIPEGMVTDHLCRVPACIRPDHPEAVTHRENVRRGRAKTISDDTVRAVRAFPGGCILAARHFDISPAYAWQLQSRRRRSDA